MAEAPPQAGSDAGTDAPPPSFMAPPAADATPDTGPIRIARFDQEHPAGTPETGPVVELAGTTEAAEAAEAATAAKGSRAGRASVVESGMSRRNLYLVGAVGAATATGAGTVALRSILSTGAPTATPGTNANDGPSPVLGTPKAPAAAAPGSVLRLPANLSTDLLVRRVTYGATPGQLDAVDRIGPQDWLTRQLDPAGLKDPDGDAIGRLFPDLARSTADLRARLQPFDGKVMTDLGAAHVGRAIWSSRQLQEVLVDFWSNLLHVPSSNFGLWDTRHRYDADVIRENAFGTYEDMLVASAIHPAMLQFLDVAESRGSNPNESYARELLEQHTVGEDAFSERDVRRTALLFTGWRVENGAPVYDLTRHFVGELKIMKFSHPNDTAATGRVAQRAFLHYLAHHERTARNVARRLAVRFVSDSPPGSLVERLAQVYVNNRTAILPVLRALFSSPELADSGGEKVRRPFERLAATVRALDVPVPRDTQPLFDLYFSLDAAGHQPLASPRVTGYPDVAAAWQSPAAALEQLNATTALVHGWWPEKLALPGPERLLDKAPADRAATVEAVARRLLGRAPTAAERSAARTLLEGTRLPATFRAGSEEQRETVALVAALLLVSPSQLAR